MPALPRDNGIINDSLKIVEEARKRGIFLRLTGGVAVRLHTHDPEVYDRFYGVLDPINETKDVDMVTYRSQSTEVDRLFQELGYKPNKLVMAYFGESRFIYHHPEDKYHVDVFFEELQFNHSIDLKPKGKSGRIELDYPTLTIADLILGKLEIHFIEEKDLKDLIPLLLFHPIADDDKPDSINANRIVSVLTHDWGFWYDAKINLQKVLDYANGLDSKKDTVTEKYLLNLKDKVSILLDMINKAPKSKEWMKRARVGTKKQWWENVEELIR